MFKISSFWGYVHCAELCYIWHIITYILRTWIMLKGFFYENMFITLFYWKGRSSNTQTSNFKNVTASYKLDWYCIVLDNHMYPRFVSDNSADNQMYSQGSSDTPCSQHCSWGGNSAEHCHHRGRWIGCIAWTRLLSNHGMLPNAFVLLKLYFPCKFLLLNSRTDRYWNAL